MATLFRNSSPGALTREQAFALEKKRMAQRRRAAEELAAQGRGGDTEIAHVTLGEIVLPDALQTAEVLNAIRQAAADANIPLERFRVGSGRNSVNPNTGAPEFSDAPYMYDGPEVEGINVVKSLLTDDPETNRAIESLHPSLRYDAAKLVNNWKDETGRQLRIPVRDATRTFEHQDDLFALGRTKPGNPVTPLRGGESYHNYGLAFDVAPLSADQKSLDYHIDFKRLGGMANERGFTWGGDFKSHVDRPHFERTYGYTADRLRQMTPRGGLPQIPGQRNR